MTKRTKYQKYWPVLKTHKMHLETIFSALKTLEQQKIDDICKEWDWVNCWRKREQKLRRQNFFLQKIYLKFIESISYILKSLKKMDYIATAQETSWVLMLMRLNRKTPRKTNKCWQNFRRIRREQKFLNQFI